MGCSANHGIQLLKSWKSVLGRELEWDDVGELIQEYRNKQELKHDGPKPFTTLQLQKFLEQIGQNRSE